MEASTTKTIGADTTRLLPAPGVAYLHQFLDTPINARNLDREFKKLLQRSGVRPIRIHDIRHTVPTVAIASGLNPKAVSEHLGHSKTSITLDIYTKVVAEQRIEVAKGIGAAMIDKETNTPQEL